MIAGSSELPGLTDGTVALRAWRASDAGAVFAACQDPDIQRWVPIPVPYLMEHARVFVAAFAGEEWSLRRGAHFAVVDPSTDVVFGAAALEDIDWGGGVAECGYWLAPAARGRGAARRAGRLLCTWAAELGLSRVELHVDPANSASVVTARGLGAVPTGRIVTRDFRGGSRDIEVFVRTLGEPA